MPNDSRQQIGAIVRIPAIPITVPLLGVAAVVVLTLLYKFSDADIRQVLSFLVLAGAVAGGAVTAYYIWAGLATSLQQRQDVLAEQRVTLALSFVQRWNDPKMADLRRDWRSLCEQLRADPSSVRKLLENDIAKRTVVADILNFCEELGYAAHCGAADALTLRKLFRGMVLKNYAATRPWIEFRRCEIPAAWSEVEWLCDQWKNTENH